MKRCLSLFLILGLIVVLAVPVSAAGNESGWIELLEYSSVQSNGENWFTVNGTTGAVSIPIMGEKRLRKVDMLVWNPTGQRFSSASVTAGGRTTTLYVYAIGSNMTRVCGYVPDAWYEVITIDLKKSTTTAQTYEVLSCKVTPVGVQEFVASASVLIGGVTYPTETAIDLGSYLNEHVATPYTARIDVADWAKYDSLTIWGSVALASIDSMRATLSTSGLPMEVNYFTQNDSGSWTEIVMDVNPSTGGVDNEGVSQETPYYGTYLFCVEIDLSNVDRTILDPLYLYVTGNYHDMYGATFTCMYVNGHVYTADTSAVSWWQRFTAFMHELFSGDSSDADEFGSTMESQSSAMQDAVDQMDQVTKPPVEDLDVSLDEYMDDTSMEGVNGVLDSIFQNDLIVTMMTICLTCALCSYVLYGKR